MPRHQRFLLAVSAVGFLAWAAFAALGAVEPSRATSDVTKALSPTRGGVFVPPEVLGSLAPRLKALEPSDQDNPVFQELLGLIAVRSLDATASFREPASRYARSLALRPVSPNTWANFAEAKYLEGDTSAAFEHAIVTASRLGPSEPHVQRMVAHYGLAVRNEVALPAREAIDRMVAAGMRRNPLEMLQIAQRRGRLDIACRHLAEAPRQLDPKWHQICQSTEARQ